jgi:hypothetical protein
VEKLVSDQTWRRSLHLLLQSHCDGAELTHEDIAEICGIDEATFERIIEQAAIRWLRYCEDVEFLDDVEDRGR